MHINTFLCSIDLVWCNCASEWRSFWESFIGSNTPDKLSKAEKSIWIQNNEVFDVLAPALAHRPRKLNHGKTLLALPPVEMFRSVSRQTRSEPGGRAHPRTMARYCLKPTPHHRKASRFPPAAAFCQTPGGNTEEAEYDSVRLWSAPVCERENTSERQAPASSFAATLCSMAYYSIEEPWYEEATGAPVQTPVWPLQVHLPRPPLRHWRVPK